MTKKKTNIKQEVEAVQAIALKTVDPTNHDLMVSMLIVSVLVNLFVLIGWVTLKVTGAYDAEVATFLFSR
jgi:hypothetical protein